MSQPSLNRLAASKPSAIALSSPLHLLRDIRAIARNYEARGPLYHSMVFRSPSLNGIGAWKANSRSSLEVSRQRRGWLSGLVVSQVMIPLKPTSLAMS